MKETATNEPSVIEGVLLEERERNLMMQRQYLSEIAQLPKGSVIKKSRKGKIYYYLSYRNGGKVVSNYLGNDAEQIKEVRHRIEKRKHLEGLVKRLRHELKIISKAVK